MTPCGSALYTLGHSNHSAAELVALLRSHEIAAVGDVRSRPYSRFNPQFNRETLAGTLRAADIDYLFLGAELGARSEDPACYEDGKVSYERLARSEPFRRGLDRLRAELCNRRFAILCAEREPLECHRTILIGRELNAAGIAVWHILADGALESQEQALERLLERLSLPGEDLFGSPAERSEAAYRLQAQRIAYQRPRRALTEKNVRR